MQKTVILPGTLDTKGIEFGYVKEKIIEQGLIDGVFDLVAHEVAAHLFVAGVRMNEEEMATLGKVVAEKLNKAIGPTAVIIPTKGFDERDKPGGVFYDPEADRAFTKALKEHIKPGIKVRELDLHLNDQAFAEAAVATLFSMMEKTTN